MPGGRPPVPFEDRLDKRGEHWIWTGAMSKGYGMVWFKGRARGAHVVAWILGGGREPESGELVCHLCDVALCCRFDHLYLGTPWTNMQDRAERTWRPPRGEQHPAAKLSDQQVRQIHRLSDDGQNRSQREIAAIVGTSQPHVGRILRGLSRSV